MPRSLLALLAAVLMVSPLLAQGDRRDAGLSREEMWRAPTAEDWAKPCLIRWQRNWADAERLARETGKPILACVNMDGEIASEHYAGIRYRQPEVAELFDGYVCVIASVYRHNPRDYDEAGNRIPCPRFGTVTCGEHIAIEPLLYAKYFDGTRVAPRHVMIELDGSENFDVYYAFDTASVFDTVREGLAGRERVAPDRTDRPSGPEGLVASPDARDRAAIEDAYRRGSHEERRRILEAAAVAGDKTAVDLLRLAVFGFEPDLARLGRMALTQSSDPAAVGLINDALAHPLPEDERAALLATLDRFAPTVPWARTLAIVHRGLGEGSAALDAGAWAASGAEALPPPDRDQLTAQLAYLDGVEDARRLDPERALALAEASFQLTRDPQALAGFGSDPKERRAYRELLVEDARRAAERAREAGADSWRLDALEAVLASDAGDFESAYAHAERAVNGLPPGEMSYNALVSLAIFASGRRAAIRRAKEAGEDWPPEWLSDVNGAYSILKQSPSQQPDEVAEQVDFLLSLAAWGPAWSVLEEGLERFPLSPMLHARYRSQLLQRGGAAGLEQAYDRLVTREDAPAGLFWYAGYASLAAAEVHRRLGEGEAAMASYQHGIERFETCLAREGADEDRVDHYVAMALAGQARVAFDAGDLERALDLLEGSFARRAASAATLDGLNINAVATAKQLAVRARAQDRSDLAERVDADLAALDPALLELPAFERGGPPLPAQRRGTGRGGR